MNKLSGIYTSTELRQLAENCRHIGHNREHLAEALEWCADHFDTIEARIFHLATSLRNESGTSVAYVKRKIADKLEALIVPTESQSTECTPDQKHK